jgi:quercetin dioxygenase-like cupin family protein
MTRRPGETPAFFQPVEPVSARGQNGKTSFANGLQFFVSPILTNGESMRPACTATELVDDDRVRVTRFDFAPGAETGWHRHGYDYVITAVTDCHMLLEEPGGGTRKVLVPAGTAYRRQEGVEHNVVNDGDGVMSFVEVELK